MYYTFASYDTRSQKRGVIIEKKSAITHSRASRTLKVYEILKMWKETFMKKKMKPQIEPGRLEIWMEQPNVKWLSLLI